MKTEARKELAIKALDAAWVDMVGFAEPTPGDYDFAQWVVDYVLDNATPEEAPEGPWKARPHLGYWAVFDIDGDIRMEALDKSQAIGVRDIMNRCDRTEGEKS